MKMTLSEKVNCLADAMLQIGFVLNNNRRNRAMIWLISETIEKLNTIIHAEVES